MMNNNTEQGTCFETFSAYQTEQMRRRISDAVFEEIMRQFGE